MEGEIIREGELVRGRISYQIGVITMEGRKRKIIREGELIREGKLVREGELVKGWGLKT